MDSALRTQGGLKLYGEITVRARKVMLALNRRDFLTANILVEAIQADLPHTTECDDEDLANDIFVLNSYSQFLASYVNLWSLILAGKYSSSWDCLQDCLNLLRSIKRFSRIKVDEFEDQLVGLEKIYPYNVFFSIGGIAGQLVCTICGELSDSASCVHISGELYGGKLAQRITRDVVQLDHIAIVSNPADKKCVVRYEDSGTQFKLVRYLRDLIFDSRLCIVSFGELEFSKKLISNGAYKILGRNEECFCGSGKKFKRCCISKEFVEHEEVIFMPKTRLISDFV